MTSATLAFLERGERIGGLARLGNGDQHRAIVDRGTAVTELGGVVHFDRNARELLDHELADQG